MVSFLINEWIVDKNGQWWIFFLQDVASLNIVINPKPIDGYI